MNNIKNACQVIIQSLVWCFRLALISLAFVSGNSLAQQWAAATPNDITLARGHKFGYQPTLSFCIERDATTGNFQVFNANQARCDRV